MSKTRNRGPAPLGTCQICGRTVSVVVTTDPVTMRSHGYETWRGDGVRIPCSGTGRPPLEVDRSHAKNTVAFLIGQVADLRQRRAAIHAGTAPPPQTRGLAALKARLDGEDDSQQRQIGVATMGAEIQQKVAQIDKIDRLLLTAASGVLRPSRVMRPRIGDIFRRVRDGKLYTIVKIDAGVRIMGKRKPASAYHCEVAGGGMHWITGNEVTRALTEAGGTLVI